MLREGLDARSSQQGSFQVKHFDINPYKPGVPFLGHMQTVQTEIRTRPLIRVFTVCQQEYLFEIELK